MTWYAQAPANIALIKYMGKTNAHLNQATNPSLSYTLNRLQTHVELETCDGPTDCWEPLQSNTLSPITLSPTAIQRFLNHLAFIKQTFGYTGFFMVRSANNFPHGAGLASSASSFAALTHGASIACAECMDVPAPSIEFMAQLSRQGSGSSCRSFFSPWVLWDADHVSPIELPYPELLHQVILIQTEEKHVSSSQAHQLVHTSPAFVNRPARARQRLDALLHAFSMQQWDTCYRLCWDEFQDMHALFHTATPAFTYQNSAALAALTRLNTDWKQRQDGPLVTMDAGANIHLLYRPDQRALADWIQCNYLADCDVW